MNYVFLRSSAALCISVLPFNKIRCFLYRKLFGYQIEKTYIGRNTIIDVESAILSNCFIGAKNMFYGPMQITIKKGASIGEKNMFGCGAWTKEEAYNNAIFKRRLELNESSLITGNHYFDVAGEFVLGKKSWIAGRNSEFWTHGAGATDRSILIGDDCYIGSAVRFSPGVSIGNNSIVGIASVVTKKFNIENVVIAGHPAKVLKENYNWKTKKEI